MTIMIIRSTLPNKPWRKDLTPPKKLYFLLRRFSTTDYLRCTALLLSTSLPSSFTINKVQKIYIEKVASPVESTLVNGASSLITGLSKLLYQEN